MRMCCTSTRHDLTRASSSRFPAPVDHLVLLRTKQQRCLLFQSWPDCTMTIERWLKEDPSKTATHERVKLCQGAIIVEPDAFERRPLARHPGGFPQCLLPERIRCSCLMECSSLRLKEEQGSLVPQSISVSRDKSDRAGQVRLFFGRLCQVANTGFEI